MVNGGAGGRRVWTRRRRGALLALAFLASPVLADHAGPGALGASGGMNVVGPETLGAGMGAVGFRLSYTRPDQRSDAELEALAGRHVHAHNSDYNLNASVGAAFGVTDRLTLSAELPYVRRDGLREGEHAHVAGQSVNEVVQLGNVDGIGDLNLIARYRLTAAESGGIALLAGVKMPTGSTHQRSLEGERLETEHQPGTDSWDPIVGAAAGTTIGAIRIDASALYQFSGKGAQRTRLGDRAQAGIALSRRFGPPDHHDEAGHEDGDHEHQALAPHGHRSWDAFVEMTGEWEGRQKVDGAIEAASGGKSLWLSPGARFNSASGLSVAASVGVPAWQRIRASHPENRYRLLLSISHAL
jgi:hypothetical protein